MSDGAHDAAECAGVARDARERTGGARDASWIRDVMLDAVAGAAASPEPANTAVTPPSTRPRQDPAFPAAFVFLTHSALYLAADVPASSTGRRGPS